MFIIHLALRFVNTFAGVRGIVVLAEQYGEKRIAVGDGALDIP